jgi:hypothetical protein
VNQRPEECSREFGHVVRSLVHREMTGRQKVHPGIGHVGAVRFRPGYGE